MDRKIDKGRWHKLRVFLPWAVVVVLIALTCTYLFADKKTALKVETERLTTSKVWVGDFGEFVPVDGVVQPGQTLFLDIFQGGMVEKVYIEDGAQVQKGDTILKLSNSSLELEYINRETQMFDILNNLQTSKTTLARNKIDLQKQLLELNYKIEVAEKKYEGCKQLYKGKAISENEYAEAERDYQFLLNQKSITLSSHQLDSAFIVTQMETLNSGIVRMRSNLEAIHRILDELYIKAPISGQLTSLNAVAGELKQAGNNIGQIDVQDFYKIKANVDERYVARVFAGQPAFLDYGGKNYDLKVAKIYPGVKDGTFILDLLFTGPAPEGITRGQTLPVRLRFGSISKAKMIARGAFYQVTGGNWIYVIDRTHNKAVKREIKTGRQNADAYEILDGLDEGEEVITSTYKNYNNIDQLLLGKPGN